MPPRRSWKPVLDARRKDYFVGREEHLGAFAGNFANDPPRYLLFAVTGEGGVGKSTLLKQFEIIAKSDKLDPPCITLVCDDQYASSASVMGHIAEKLRELGVAHKEFDERFKTYRGLRQDIETDVKAPRGALNLVTRGMTDFAIKAARKVPGIGVFAEYVDEKSAGEALSQGVDYLVNRWGNKDEVQLLREPERILTPLFIELLNKACERHRLVIFFDVFERTGEALSTWLLELLRFEFGEFDTHLSFVIAGRDPLEQRWTELNISICYIALEPFSPDETKAYLSNQGIFDERLVTQIHEDTGGLPVLVELLASRKPQPGTPLPDISKDAVARFLQWIPEERRRQAVLLAAVPRQFNRDVLGAALNDATGAEFNWLAQQSFVRTEAARGWFYHERVRELMLRFVRNTSPREFAEAHERVAQYFQDQQEALKLDVKEAYETDAWKRCEREQVYHTLCAQPSHAERVAMRAFFAAFRWRWGFAEDIANMCVQAGRDTGDSGMKSLADELLQVYQCYDEKRYRELVSLLNKLQMKFESEKLTACMLFMLRGYAYLQIDEHSQAIADLSCVIEIDNKYDWAIASRGDTYQEMKQYEQAIADFTRAIELDNKNAWSIASRGQAHQSIKQYDQAIADFTHAIKLDNKLDWAISDCCVTYWLVRQFDLAIANFTRAIELDDKYVWAIVKRGQVFAELGRRHEAIVDFNRALALNTALNWVLEQRGLYYLLESDFNLALQDFDEAISIDSDDCSLFANRGEAQRRLGKPESAIADFTQAVALNDEYALAMARRSALYQQLGHPDLAQTDFEQALAVPIEDESDHYARAIVFAQTNKPNEALAALREAIHLDPFNRQFAQKDDLLDPIRLLPAFQALLQEP